MDYILDKANVISRSQQNFYQTHHQKLKQNKSHSLVNFDSHVIKDVLHEGLTHGGRKTNIWVSKLDHHRFRSLLVAYSAGNKLLTNAMLTNCSLDFGGKFCEIWIKIKQLYTTTELWLIEMMSHGHYDFPGHNSFVFVTKQLITKMFQYYSNNTIYMQSKCGFICLCTASRFNQSL